MNTFGNKTTHDVNSNIIPKVLFNMLVQLLCINTETAENVTNKEITIFFFIRVHVGRHATMHEYVLTCNVSYRFSNL